MRQMGIIDRNAKIRGTGSSMGSTEARYCTQIPEAEAIAYLLADHQEYTNWNEYRERYWRKATQAEQRAYHNASEDVIMVTAMKVEREDAPEPANKPFQRFCMIPDEWREMARDIMIEREQTRLHKEGHRVYIPRKED